MASVDMVGSVLALLVIDNEGYRLLAKYYNLSLRSVDEELDFEKRIFSKASKMAGQSPECKGKNNTRWNIKYWPVRGCI